MLVMRFTFAALVEALVGKGMKDVIVKVKKRDQLPASRSRVLKQEILVSSHVEVQNLERKLNLFIFLWKILDISLGTHLHCWCSTWRCNNINEGFFAKVVFFNRLEQIWLWDVDRPHPEPL